MVGKYTAEPGDFLVLINSLEQQMEGYLKELGYE